MKRIAIAVLLLLLAPVAAEAQQSCHSDQQVIQHPDNRVVTSGRGTLASFQIAPGETEGRTFGVKGMVCGIDLAPLDGQRLELIRYERRQGSGPVSPDDLTNGNLDTFETHALSASAHGKFVVTGLRAGKYLLVADWSAVPAESTRVVFNLQVVPGPSPQSPIAQAGLLQR